MSEGRFFFGRKALWPRVAFFCTWCATANHRAQPEEAAHRGSERSNIERWSKESAAEQAETKLQCSGQMIPDKWPGRVQQNQQTLKRLESSSIQSVPCRA